MKRALPAAILFLCAAAGFAFSPASLSPRIGVMIIKNVETTGIGAPNALVNTLGASISFPFPKNDRFSFEPGVDVYWTHYGWGTDGRAHLVEGEYAESAFVLGALLDAPVFFRWSFAQNLEGMFGLGGAVVLRAAFLASGSDESTDVRSIGSWFYRKMRWIYPNAQFRLSYRLQEKFTFEFMTRGFLPLFNALDSEAPSFWDHAMLDITMGMRIKLN